MEKENKYEYLKSILSSERMIVSHEFKLFGKRRAVAFYSDSLVDKLLIDTAVMPSLLEKKRIKVTEENVIESLPHLDCSAVEIPLACEKVFSGQMLLYVFGFERAIVLDVKKCESRAVAEPPTGSVVKGPREGFTENINTNISLVKKRLKSEKLKFRSLTIGRISKTSVAICYLSGIADEKTVDKIEERLRGIDIDGIIDSSYLKEHLSKHKLSVFPEVGDTERPDILCARMLEGRVGIIVEGSPIVLTLPFLFLEHLQSGEDYYTIPYNGAFLRFIRLISLFFALFMPGFYVATEIYHIQFIPLRFLLTIASGTKGIPFSPSLEMIFILMLFEILNEASIRMPKYVGSAISIVGALVLGDTAVRAGIVSSPTILIVSLSAIALYTIPDERSTLSMLRLLFLLLAGSLGLVGMISGGLVICYYLCSLNSYGVPYLAPFAPYISNDQKDGIMKSPMAITNDRPQSLMNKNKRRIG